MTGRDYVEFIGIPLVKPSNRAHGKCIMAIGAIIMIALYAVGKSILPFSAALPLVASIATVLLAITYGINKQNIGPRAPIVIILLAFMAAALSEIPMAIIIL